MVALDEHTINFTGLKDGEHEFRFDLDKRFFDRTGDEDLDGGTLAALVTLDKRGNLMVANIHLEGSVEVLCDHCNAPLSLSTSGDQRQIFQLNAEEDLDDDELVGLDAHAHSINLSHYFYECLRLALPARRLHPPGSCDPEVEAVLDKLRVDETPAPDPRWEALNQLKTPDEPGMNTKRP